jgi:hypothetical protein
MSKNPTPDAACACGQAIHVTGIYRDRLITAFWDGHRKPGCQPVERLPTLDKDQTGAWGNRGI